MKRINLLKVIVSLLLCVYVAIGCSQVYFAPLIGINISSYNISNYQGPSITTKTGLSIGFGVVFENTKKISVKTEFRYSSMGAATSTNSSTNSEIVTSQNYITSHLLLKFKLRTNEESRGYFELGPRIGYGLGDVTVSTNKSVVSESWDKARLNKMDFGIEAGIGVDFKSGSNRLDFDLRYYYGIKNISEEAPVEFRNNGFCISACLYL